MNTIPNMTVNNAPMDEYGFPYALVRGGGASTFPTGIKANKKTEFMIEVPLAYGGFRPVAFVVGGVPASLAARRAPAAQKIASNPPFRSVAAGGHRNVRGASAINGQQMVLTDNVINLFPEGQSRVIGFRPTFLAYNGIPLQTTVSLVTAEAVTSRAQPVTPTVQKITTTPPNRSDRNEGSRRLDRGGSWYLDASFARAGFRRSSAPDGRNGGIGFRPVFFAYSGVPAQTTVNLSTAPVAAVGQKITATPPNRSLAASDTMRLISGGSMVFGRMSATAHRSIGFTVSLRDADTGFRPVFFAYRGLPAQTMVNVSTAPAAVVGQKISTTPPDRADRNSSAYRVNRGGSWIGDASYSRFERRGGGIPSLSFEVLGFRPVFFAYRGLPAQTTMTLTNASQAAATPAPRATTIPNRSVQSSSDRVSRGAGWNRDVASVRAGSRYSNVPGYRDYRFGFRPVFTAFDVMEIMAALPAVAARPVAPAAPRPQAPPPPPPAPPPPPQPTGPTYLLPTAQRDANVFVALESSVKEAKKTSFFKEGSRIQSLNLSPAVRTAFAYGTDFSNKLDPEYTIDRPQLKDYYASIFNTLPDQQNYYYLFDVVRFTKLGIVPFGWALPKIPLIKTSYDGGFAHTYKRKSYQRMHSAGDRSDIFTGSGTPLYMGGAIALGWTQDTSGIHSDSGRSGDAEAFWRRARETGLAIRDTSASKDIIDISTALGSVLTVRGPYEPYGPYATMTREFQANNPTEFNSRANKKKMALTGSEMVILARGEMLARAMFFMTKSNAEVIREMIEATGNKQALKLFDERADIQSINSQSSTSLSGLGNALRVRRPMPPIPAPLAGFVQGMYNPF